MLLWKLGYRNLWRNRRRTILTMSAIGFAAAMVILMLGIYEGMLWDMIESATNLYYGHVQVTAEHYPDKRQIYLTLPQDGLYEKIKQDRPKGLLAKTFEFKKTELLVPEDPYFSVVIPKIAANAKVQSNIDPTDEKVYLEALKKGVAHALGTAFPGEGGHVFLYAHSTDYLWNVGSYNAVFYLLYKLEKGDEINVFYKGKRNVYKVIDKKVVTPSEVEYLTRKTNKEFLTLQTCWPPGTTLKRLLVFATRVAE